MPKLTRHRKVQIIVTSVMIIGAVFPDHAYLGLVMNVLWIWGE